METIKKYLFNYIKKDGLGYDATRAILEKMYEDLESGELDYSHFQDGVMNLVSPLNTFDQINSWNDGLDRLILKISDDEDEEKESEVRKMLKEYFINN